MFKSSGRSERWEKRGCRGLAGRTGTNGRYARERGMFFRGLAVETYKKPCRKKGKSEGKEKVQVLPQEVR